MNDQPVARDERTVAVEHAGSHVGFIILLFGVLITAAARAWIFNETVWDLLGLATLSSLAATFYQLKHRTLAAKWWKAAIFLVVVGAVTGLVSVVLAIMLKRPS